MLSSITHQVVESKIEHYTAEGIKRRVQFVTAACLESNLEYEKKQDGSVKISRIAMHAKQVKKRRKNAITQSKVDELLDALTAVTTHHSLFLRAHPYDPCLIL